jgi:formylglycine-generating enzyme required for sulfatase activity
MCVSEAPVSNAQFLEFVRDHPEWRKSRVPRLFAEEPYLGNWRDDLTPPPESLREPVTRVSWFAADAYCESQGARLPKVSEWERMAVTLAAPSASAPFSVALGKPAEDLAGTPLRMHGIWEWTEDFNSAVVVGGGDTAQGGNAKQFCGDGFRAVDPSDYAAFLRYSFRSSLRANFTLKNLGFRCTRDAP